MTCPNCGSNIREGGRVCFECGELIRARVGGDALAVAVQLSMQVEEHPARPTYTAYPGSLVLRAIAWLLDQLIWGGLLAAVVLLYLELNGLARTGAHVIDALKVVALPFAVAQFVLNAVMEASRLRATPGKLMVGLVVGDEEGAPLGLLHAMWRSFIKSVLMSFVPLEVLIALVVDDNQTVHDMIAGTNVYSR